MTKDCDAVVVGGGLEGCVAAIALGRAGKKVVLLENGGSLGGMATNGLCSYIPATKPNGTLSARGLRAELLAAAGAGGSDGPTLYDEQRMKLVLAKSLGAAGVRPLTHVFASSTILEGGKPAGVVVKGKVGAFELRAPRLVDATDLMETAEGLGVEVGFERRAIGLGVKMNEIDFARLRASREPAGPAASLCSLAFPRRWDVGGLRVFTDELLLLCDEGRDQLIIHGLKAEASGAEPLLLSALLMRMRICAYRLLEELRASEPGFSRARIIHAATRLDLRGLRRLARGTRVPRGVSFCCDAPGPYDNASAIERGLAAAFN